MVQLTEEQQAVVNHPLGKHARVLAVAGSGKTSTLVERVRHLVLDERVRPRDIIVLMYNRWANQSFVEKLTRAVPTAAMRPEVRTFNSMGARILAAGTEFDVMHPGVVMWAEHNEELHHFALRDALKEALLEVRGSDALEYEEWRKLITQLGEAIRLWKCSLIPYDRAGYRGNPIMEVAYAKYEAIRLRRRGRTFDDQVPDALALIDRHPDVLHKISAPFRHVIVDEFQDVDEAQHRLIEKLGGLQTDYMVVGDDDQTINEWRGARPRYILEEFGRRFVARDASRYILSRTFRFGGRIAKASDSLIKANEYREPKDVIAHDPDLPGQIMHFVDWERGAYTSDVDLGDQLEATLGYGVPPSSIAVLGRSYAQLAGMQVEMLRRRIPYRVIGERSLFDEADVRTLVNILDLGIHLDSHVDTQLDRQIEQVVKALPTSLPSGMLATWRGGGLFADDETVKTSLQRLLGSLGDKGDQYRDKLKKLATALSVVHRGTTEFPQRPVGGVVEHVVAGMQFEEQYEHFWGDDEPAEAKCAIIRTFVAAAREHKGTVDEFLRWIREADPGRGVPEDQMVTVTTVYRTKGLEYDVVILPRCDEGLTPVRQAQPWPIYDKDVGADHDLTPPNHLESERRLFYVGVTRAKHYALIGSAPDNGLTGGSGSQSRFVKELMLHRTQATARVVRPDIAQAIDGEIHAVPGEVQPSGAPVHDARRVIAHVGESIVAVFGQASQGTGLVVEATASHWLVATAAHLLGPARHAVVRLKVEGETKSFFASAITYDARRDVVVLGVRGVRGRVLAPATSSVRIPGDRLLLVGFKDASRYDRLAPTAAEGLYSAHRTIEGVPYLHCDAAVAPGMMGAPLATYAGDVVGLAVRVASARASSADDLFEDFEGARGPGEVAEVGAPTEMSSPAPEASPSDNRPDIRATEPAWEPAPSAPGAATTAPPTGMFISAEAIAAAVARARATLRATGDAKVLPKVVDPSATPSPPAA
jgi:DNA helicase-2/ATP-dependent DNA helicase PcrA